MTSEKAYRQILKSTSIMGASSIINIVLRIVRTKVLAVLLGPAGIGLIGIYDSITTGLSNVVGIGIGNSGVRQIAFAYGAGDEEKISKTVIVLRRTAMVSGILGMCVLLALSGFFSRLTFGNPGHTFDLALLSITVLFTVVSSGQIALIQGTRRISDLAFLSVLGALMGTLFSIPVVYYMGEKGIVVFLIVVPGMGLLTSWWYSRKIKVSNVTMNMAEMINETKPLLRLGVAFMAGSLLSAASAYLLRVVVVKTFDLNAVGAYQAATTLSTVYVGIILNSMITDFYPRLTASVNDHQECTSLINKQIEIGLLLTIPGVLATITFSPLVIELFYSSKFAPAVEILRWQVLGAFLQVITWPMGFMLRAAGKGKLFFWTELFDNAMFLGLSLVGIRLFGLKGTGIAFMAKNVVYGLLILYIISRHYQYSFSSGNLRTIALLALLTGAVFMSQSFLGGQASLLVNTSITLAVAFFSFKTILKITDLESRMGLLFKIKARFGF